jgi:hypothetical protein
VVLVLGLLAGFAMLLSLLSTIVSVDVANGSCEVIYDSNPDLADGCSLSGYERHSIAFVLLGLLAFAMAFGAGPGRSRPAALALVAIGLIVLGVALLSDLPVSDDTGAIGRDFEGATASAGSGLWLEAVAGALAVAAGALRLLSPGPSRSRRRPERTHRHAERRARAEQSRH